MQQQNDDYNRWGPRNEGTPPVPAPLGFSPAKSEWTGFAIVTYLVTVILIGNQLLTLLAGWSAFVGWSAIGLVALILLWAWPVIYTVAIFLVCGTIIGYCAILLIRAFAS